MSDNNVAESLCSEWVDSSQNSVNSDGEDHHDALWREKKDLVLEESNLSKSTETINPSNSAGTSLNDTGNSNTNLNHLVSEETILHSETPPQENQSEAFEEKDNVKNDTKKPTSKAKRPVTKRKPPAKIITKNKKPVDKVKDAPLPSVYSKKQIARHTKRINKLKALEQDSSSSETGSEPENDTIPDRDLDINLRIFEESVKSIDKVVIGEIQCNILDDKSCTEIINNANLNSPSIFQLSVNTNYVDNCDRDESLEKNSAEGKTVIEDVEICDDPLDFSDNDSDLEILSSKPIIRKRSSQPFKKEKPIEKKQKLTMYDLIHDNVLLSPEVKEEDNDPDQQEEMKMNETKKSKVTNKKPKFKKEERLDEHQSKTETKDDSQNLPVPKLKVGADGEVVIDMDSLVIEQTGVSEARNALANSEIIEEHNLSYISYNRKNSFRKQWTPHETLKFYQVLSTIGTDFTLMATLFPGRTRKCMKRKFKREEKTNADLIMKALSCKQNFNISLLEKELQLKEEKVNQFKENNKKQKVKKKPPNSRKQPIKTKRRSFFESSVSSFRDD